ncbi:hypothetical protein FW778_14450 [Ginsengibacter hankyongi]|uniref:Uncharacterized protein n=1 Tax=Ginsengibacter hankyongi TaxID=2607284 RepID=A0A5J5IH42_9BACT|nr:hypothetical protein [Ginsengibacter hankyongi]KAA9038741.1 hypothetical protein FW778_14450 [Ginsengibacter hankyongi]
MKRLKISMFALFAIVLGIAASAFTSRHETSVKKGPETIAWFQFMGDPTSLAQVKDNTEYQYQGGLPCSGSNAICAVQTNGVATSGHNPDPFSSTLKTELTNVFNGTNTYADISQEP